MGAAELTLDIQVSIDTSNVLCKFSSWLWCLASIATKLWGCTQRNHVWWVHKLIKVNHPILQLSKEASYWAQLPIIYHLWVKRKRLVLPNMRKLLAEPLCAKEKLIGNQIRCPKFTSKGLELKSLAFSQFLLLFLDLYRKWTRNEIRCPKLKKRRFYQIRNCVISQNFIFWVHFINS